MKILSIILSTLILVACGGGDETPVAIINTSVPHPVANAATVSGGSAVAVHVYQALYGMAPSNATLSAHTVQATSDPSAFARNLASNFSSTSHTALAKLVLDNLGVTAATVTAVGAQGQSEYAILLDALGQMFTFYGTDARGQIILNATNLLADLESDPTYGATAFTYNKQASVNFSYSSNSANTVAAAISTATANAGATQNVTAGSLVTLDGSASKADVGRTLTYAWTLTSKPAGSTAVLSSATSAKPTFTADMAGTYVARLILNDGRVNSTAATVSIAAAIRNVAPVANAGGTQNVGVGGIATLDGSKSSDSNGDPLTYDWTLTSKPAGSLATLSSPTSLRPTFAADLVGPYIATLTVNDGSLRSASVTTTVTAVPRIVGALGISIDNSYSFCGITGTFSTFSSSGSGTWTFNNCSVYGTAGSPLMVRIQNNGMTPLTLTRISIYTPPFVKDWTINPTSQTIDAGTHVDFSLPLHVGVEVTNATATFSIQGEPPLVVHLTGNMTLAMLLFNQ